MQKKILWIDVARGLGILLVMIGHIEYSNFIYSFHLPLFFIISGYTHNSLRLDNKIFITKKIKSLVIPYFALGLILILSTLFFMWYKNQSLTITGCLNLLMHFIIQRRMWTLWFLACLFVLTIYFHLLIKLTNNNLLKITQITVLSVIIMKLYYNYGGNPWIWNSDASVMALPFYLIGYTLKKYSVVDRFHSKKYNIVIFTLVMLLICQLTFLKLNLSLAGGTLEMYDSSYAILPFTYISAISGSLLIIYISKYINNRVIIYIGQNSIIYFALHQTVIYPLLYIFYDKWNIFNSEHIFVKITKFSSTLVISIILLTMISIFIRRFNLKIFTGIR